MIFVKNVLFAPFTCNHPRSRNHKSLDITSSILFGLLESRSALLQPTAIVTITERNPLPLYTQTCIKYFCVCPLPLN